MTEIAERETFGEVLRAMRFSHHLTQEALAKILGISLKTLSRWELGETAPTRFQKHGLVAAVGAGFPEHRDRLAVALGLKLEPAEVVAPPPGPNMAILGAALEGALFQATETLGVPPSKVREAVALVLDRVALIGIDAQTAARLVRGKG